jgi:hypothetical protein
MGTLANQCQPMETLNVTPHHLQFASAYPSNVCPSAFYGPSGGSHVVKHTYHCPSDSQHHSTTPERQQNSSLKILSPTFMDHLGLEISIKSYCQEAIMSLPSLENLNSEKKRGKYKIYSDEEKQQILVNVNSLGMENVLSDLSGGGHKLTKRKLKSWQDSQGKVKKTKGRKSNDIPRDTALLEWCRDFQSETGRMPTRKEAGKKALELNNDPKFKASKGWLDKFSRKFDIEFTPLKVFPPKVKRVKIQNSASSPQTSTTGSSRTTANESVDGSPKQIKSEDYSCLSDANNHEQVNESDFVFSQEPQLFSSFNHIKPMTNTNTLYEDCITNNQYAFSPKFQGKSFPRFLFGKDDIANSEFNDKLLELDINSFLNFP